MPTYVSKPLAPRTVRTIDLSGPTVAATIARPQHPGHRRRRLSRAADARDEADGDEQREAATASSLGPKSAAGCRTSAPGICRNLQRTDGKVCVLFGPGRSAGLWRSW